MIFVYLSTIIPFVFLVFFMAVPCKKNRTFIPPSWMSFFFIIILVLCFSEFPLQAGEDRDRYEQGYLRTLVNGIDLENKDVGWIIYEVVCSKLFGSSIMLFWLISSFIYIYSYFCFGKSYFGNRKVLYFLVLSAGMLGFVNYGTNTIRQGIASAILLLSIAKNKNICLQYTLFVLALLFHKSMLIPEMSYLVAKYFKNTKAILCFWVLSIILSYVVSDFATIFVYLGFVDDRVSGYISGQDVINGVIIDYNSGFRVDFLIYSLTPLLFSYYYIIKAKYRNDIYMLFLRLYLLTNAIWVLAIRIPYSDRLAYLSWLYIPVLLLYPLLDEPITIKHPQKFAVLTMLLFMGVNVLLLIR